MNALKTGYKIVSPAGLFSKGIVTKARNDYPGEVKFTSKGGKVWTDTALLKKHLLTCIQERCFNTSWQVVEVTHVPKGKVEDWLGPRELMAILKK